MKQKPIKIGQIVRPFKIAGELKVKCFTDIPHERFKVGNKVILKTPQHDVETTIMSFRMHQNHALITCDAITDRNQAETVRFVIIEQMVAVDPKRITLHDLEGCTVHNYGVAIGTVAQAMAYPAQTLLSVKLYNGKTILIPYVDSFVVKVDLQSATIWCELIEGFL